ncbi:MAG: DUF262 domain-containing protein [Aureispira sp.]
MALSLNAEQCSIAKMFKREEQYIIPAFQRPYSWDYEQCLQLYNDLTDAYKSAEDYFVGNIILAVSNSEKKKLEVIDGQQRLTTFFLMIKVIAVLEGSEHIDRFIQSTNWKGEVVIRLESKIIETADPQNLFEILQYDQDRFEKRLEECLIGGKDKVINARKCNHKFEQNALCFYQWLRRFKQGGEDAFQKFMEYLFENVYLLPIQLTGKTSEDARRKALIIFETVNNRGMSLEDADIFKAKLYEAAEKVKEADAFISEWQDFRSKCDDLGLEIDDIFRYYSHIVRGKKGITSNETNMREFFINQDFSPFNNKSYKEVLEDLFQIITIVEYIEQEQKRATPLAKWLQLIDYYSNQYPKWALIVYLFTNGLDESRQEVTSQFCKSLIRYVYAKGATTTIKYEIYNIIKQVSQGGFIKSYEQNFEPQHLYPLGRLKYGYALLAYYIERENALTNYYVGKIFNTRDFQYFEDYIEGWKSVEMSEKLDHLANFVVADIPQRQILFQNKKSYFETSKLNEVKAVFEMEYTYQKFEEREAKLVKTLLDFFNQSS